jgi:hypothetical protein
MQSRVQQFSPLAPDRLQHACAIRADGHVDTDSGAAVRKSATH